jgi:PIN domain nuclease of toxin-antitoxin system
MSRIVLDASAILAIINKEPGHEKLTSELLREAVCCTVNLAEVQAKLVSRGWSPGEAWEDATSPIQEAVAFTMEHARRAGDLVLQGKRLGLSLGDRACLAVAAELKCPVYTTDKAWRELKTPVKIHILR